MSLKITLELNGQSEQQFAPVVGSLAARYPELLGNSAPETVATPATPNLYHENPALLQQAAQQQIQQLAAQNRQLQAQVAYGQQRLAAARPQAQLNPASSPARSPAGNPPQAKDSHRAGTAAPTLPAQYQAQQRAIALWRCRKLCRTLAAPPVWLWRGLRRIAPSRTHMEWGLLFLLLCGGVYGTVEFAPRLASWLFPRPEFSEATDGSPGEAKSQPETDAAEDVEGTSNSQRTSPIITTL